MAVILTTHTPHTHHTPHTTQVKRRRGKTAQMEEDQLEGEWAYERVVSGRMRE